MCYYFIGHRFRIYYFLSVVSITNSCIDNQNEIKPNCNNSDNNENENENVSIIEDKEPKLIMPGQLPFAEDILSKNFTLKEVQMTRQADKVRKSPQLLLPFVKDIISKNFTLNQVNIATKVDSLTKKSLPFIEDIISKEGKEKWHNFFFSAFNILTQQGQLRWLSILAGFNFLLSAYCLLKGIGRLVNYNFHLLPHSHGHLTLGLIQTSILFLIAGFVTIFYRSSHKKGKQIPATQKKEDFGNAP